MAEHDVNDAFGADLLDTFVVVRRKETVNAYGESTSGSQRIRASGVVCRATPDDLKRLPEADLGEAHISVVSPFQFYGPAVQGSNAYKPDVIEWKGSSYVVKAVDPYPHMGRGFSQVIAGSVDSVDEAPA